MITTVFYKEINMSSPNSKLPNLGSKTEEFISMIEEMDTPPLYKMTPENARNFLNKLQEKTHQEIEADVTDTAIFTDAMDNVEVRVVRPKNNNEKLPAIIYVHGGGWILGNKNVYDMLTRKLACCTNSIVIFPEYMLAPEGTYPTQTDQIYATLQYIYENPNEFNIDRDKIAIVGDSVGGNMATVTALRTKNEKGPKLLFQCLFYPVTSADMDTKSYDDFKDGPWLTKKAMEWFWDTYQPNKKLRNDPYISPLNAEIDDLKGLPPALIVTDENDVLRDEGEAYARKLDLAGVDVLNVRVNGTFHDFLMLNGLADTPQAKDTLEMACTILKKVLHS